MNRLQLKQESGSVPGNLLILILADRTRPITYTQLEKCLLFQLSADGEMYHDRCNTCTCIDGNFECTNKNCEVETLSKTCKIDAIKIYFFYFI